MISLRGNNENTRRNERRRRFLRRRPGILKEAGHEVIGATMSVWDNGRPFNLLSHKDACFSPHEAEDTKEAREVCQKLDIPYHVIDCTKEYQRLVLANFKKEYLAGRTPNPCVWCNSAIKFQALPRSAKAAGIDFDKFATGHYARLSFNEELNRFQLRRAVDEKKDQTYFLYRLSQEQLAQILLPLGELTKSRVREIARRHGLKVSDQAPTARIFIPATSTTFCNRNPSLEISSTKAAGFSVSIKESGTSQSDSAAASASVPTVPYMLLP